MQRILIALAVWATVITSAAAQDLAQQRAALSEIRQTAADICYTVQQEGQSSDKELSGKVQAQLNGVISKVVDLNVDAAGKLKNQQYQGVLQVQLAETLKQSADCRKDVFDKLVGLMLSPPAPPSPNQSSSKPQILIRKVSCLAVGAGRYEVELSGEASGLPDTRYLLYTEVDTASGGMRFRPDCSQWRAAQPEDDSHFGDLSCIHQPGDHPSTLWRMSTTMSTGSQPTQAFVGLLEPKMGKEFMTNATMPISCHQR